VAGDVDFPSDPASDPLAWRKKIEPWLSAVFQAEHLSLLVGNGFTSAMAGLAAAKPVSLSLASFGCANEDKVNARAVAAAKAMGRGSANLEDQLSAALAFLAGLQILEDKNASAWKKAIDGALDDLIKGVVETERAIKHGFGTTPKAGDPSPKEALVSFLLSFASRAASRERTQIFTVNYDRLLEFGCDSAGLRIVDRFVGSIEPEFRSSRLHIDLHYTPPGTRGEPRHLEGVVHLTKLHGSIDWRYDRPRLYRSPIPFGADASHPMLPESASDSVLVFPNAIKDVETAAYPYADLFRDFSSAICQPNSVLVTYGYGFGDDHVNRIIADMLTIPSTHLVAIAWGAKPHERVASFLSRAGHPQQISLLLGTHFADILQLVKFYLPKPAIDPLTIKMSELLERRNPR